MYLPHTTPTMTELLVLSHSLAIAKANNLTHFSIETNSRAILSIISNDHLFYHNLIVEFKSLMEETQFTIPIKIFQEPNAVVDTLAKEGAKSQVMESPQLFWQMPLFVSAHVQSDSNGALAHRRIKNNTINLLGQDVAPNNLLLTLLQLEGV